MRKNAIVFLLLVLATTAPALTRWSEPSVDEQVKYLAQRYNEIEAQLDRSIHYTRTTTEAGVTRLEQAWLNGANDPIKMAIDETGPSGRELTEYFVDPQDPSTGTVVLHRKETPRPDGAGPYGPGHGSFVSIGPRESVAVFHATDAPTDGWENRKARCQRVVWTPNGPRSRSAAVR